jgi:Papain family cysteine protease
MDYAFEYITANGGLDTEADYGYWSFDLPCQSSKERDRHVVSIDGFQDVPPGSGAALKSALAHQPIAVAICANSALQFYGSGVFSADACCSQLNHGVLAVGYSDGGDSDAAKGSHWLVKNSWGGGTCAPSVCAVCVLGAIPAAMAGSPPSQLAYAWIPNTPCDRLGRVWLLQAGAGGSQQPQWPLLHLSGPLLPREEAQHQP